MNLNSLAKKAAKFGDAPQEYGGAMEVENMIKFVLIHQDAAASEIERLYELHGWLDDGVLPNGSRVAPFGMWAKVCIAYGRGGVSALSEFLNDDQQANFALAILEKIRSLDAVLVVLQFAERSSWKSDDVMDSSWKSLSALNLLLSLKDGVSIDECLQKRLLAVCRCAFEQATTAYIKTIVIYATRACALIEAIDWLKLIDPKSSEISDAIKVATKEINRRLAPNYTVLTKEQKRQASRDRASDV